MSSYNDRRRVTIDDAVREAIAGADTAKVALVRHVADLLAAWDAAPAGDADLIALSGEIAQALDELHGIDPALADEQDHHWRGPTLTDPSEPWSRQTDYVRSIIDLFHKADPGSEDADDLEAEIRHEILRLAGIDSDLAVEVECEFHDPHAGPAAGWSEDTDRDRWGIPPGGPGPGEGPVDPADFQVTAIDPDGPFAAPDDDVPEARMRLHEWIGRVADSFYTCNTFASDLIGDAIADLAADVRACGARTPGQARDRMLVLHLN